MRRSSKKHKNIIIPILIAVFITAIAVTGIYAFAGEYLINKWRMASMSPKEYYAYIEKKNVDKMIQTVVSTYSMAKNATGIYDSLNVDSLWDSFVADIDNGSLIPNSGIHLSIKLLEELAKGIGRPDLRNIDIYILKDAKEEYDVLQLSVYNNDEEALLVNCLLGWQGGNYIEAKNYIEGFIKLPDINIDSLDGLLPSITDLNEQGGIEGDDGSLEASADLSKELREFLEGFFYYFIEHADGAVLEKGVQFDKAGDGKCNVITAEYTLKELFDALSSFISKLSYDESFYLLLNKSGLIKDKMEMNIYISTARSLLQGVLNAYKEDGRLTFKLYVSNEGKLLYRDIQLASSLSAVSDNAEAAVDIGYGAGYGFSVPEVSVYDDVKNLAEVEFSIIESPEIILEEYPDEDNCIRIQELSGLLDIFN